MPLPASSAQPIRHRATQLARPPKQIHSAWSSSEVDSLGDACAGATESLAERASRRAEPSSSSGKQLIFSLAQEDHPTTGEGPGPNREHV